jgi:CheY-like chemotaxis protein
MMRVLVVDDDEGIRDSLTELLEDEGHQVMSAENGADALTKLAAMTPAPDLILLDLMMPVKDGFAFRSEQRADERFSAIPVVAMSAMPRREGRWEALGAREYLQKPFQLDALIQALRL